MWADLSKRPYIIAGSIALLGLIPLAVTSTRGWRRRLGRGWLTLHRLIYAILPTALLHLWWLTKDGYGEVLVYAAIFAALMAERWWRVWRTRVWTLGPVVAAIIGGRER